jgi:hypothetical protein
MDAFGKLSSASHMHILEGTVTNAITVLSVRISLELVVRCRTINLTVFIL